MQTWIFIIVVIVLIGLIATVTVIWRLSNSNSNSNNTNLKPEIYCIMVTGKDDCRENFAKQSVDNFNSQDYPRKKLIILNHSPNYKVINAIHDNIHEFVIDKEANKMTLGDLRNIGLAMVPPDAIWTTWDDDDFRAPNYLSVMQNEMAKHDAHVLTFTERIEFNANTGYVWQMIRKSGFAILFAKQDMRILYESLDTMEDTKMLDTARALGKRVYIYSNNDPNMYIRTVHGNNTSLYAGKYKNKIAEIETHQKENTDSQGIQDYIERDIDPEHANNVRGFMSSYYKKGIECYTNK